jgi:hypothetical protein
VAVECGDGCVSVIGLVLFWLLIPCNNLYSQSSLTTVTLDFLLSLREKAKEKVAFPLLRDDLLSNKKKLFFHCTIYFLLSIYFLLKFI